jgi:cysteine-rich repeat protein
MSKNHVQGSLIALAAGLAACTGGGADSSAQDVKGGNLSGAIFTTNMDGTRVNQNIYRFKEDVYLDGGPGENAPAKAAGLPEGDYFFQVTNPNGKVLLSEDAIECRSVHVSSDGVITAVNQGPAGCQHLTGIDQDHSEIGAITVQLMPYADTPNPGGEYKVWMTPVGDYDVTYERTHGFIPRFSKTDNYKVRFEVIMPPPPPPVCGNGVVEEGEQCDDGNTVDGDGCSANCTVETPPPPPCCGNGIVEQGETCDDGNTVDGDGCSSTCTIEVPPPPPCGNGVVDQGETCDDGNTVDGDGCSSTCQCEPT